MRGSEMRQQRDARHQMASRAGDPLPTAQTREVALRPEMLVAQPEQVRFRGCIRPRALVLARVGDGYEEGSGR
jgi:hypothetical protein